VAAVEEETLKSSRFAYLSDIHCPFVNHAAWAAALGIVKSHRPDLVVIGGDLFESGFASVHPNEYDHDGLDEYESAATLLDTLRNACPKAKRVWLLGNHDDNIQKRDPRRVPKSLRRLVHWDNSKYSDSFKAWHQVPYVKSERGCYQLGQVIFKHGFSLNDELEALQFSNYTGGFAHRLVIGGHTHAPTPPMPAMRTKKISLPLWYANAGTLCDIDKLEYMDRNDKWAWGAAVVLGDCDPSGPCLPGKCWEAETRVLRMHSQWSPHSRPRRR